MENNNNKPIPIKGNELLFEQLCNHKDIINVGNRSNLVLREDYVKLHDDYTKLELENRELKDKLKYLKSVELEYIRLCRKVGCD